VPAEFPLGPPRGPVAAIERLLRGGDNGYYGLFEEAAGTAARAAELLERLLDELPDGESFAAEIRACERLGDTATQSVMRRLNESFVTPIDREDIMRLATALDDITDFIDETADYLILYRVEAPMAQAQELAVVLVGATRALAQAVERMGRLDTIVDAAEEVHRLESAGDRILRQAIASLFEARIDPMVVIRWKDIFERLEDAIDATERAMYVLQGIFIKNV
jgi:predicted phosphate transport protein (TIGR00153 family)